MIISTLFAIHPNPILVTDDYYLRIPTHMFFSAGTVRHFGQVMDRLRTILQILLMEFIGVDVVQVSRPSWTNAAPNPVPVAFEDTTGWGNH